MKKNYLFSIAMVAMSIGGYAQVNTEIINPDANATAYEADPGNANGKHQAMGVGNTASGEYVYALFRFDLSAVPEDADIKWTELEFRFITTTFQNSISVDVYQMTEAWTEGPASPNDMTVGSPASAGDVTWDHASYPDDWTGGTVNDAVDYSASLGFKSVLEQNGQLKYDSTNSTLKAWVTNWVTNPDDNYGIVITSSDPDVIAAVRGRHSSAANQPVLTVHYEEDEPADTTGVKEITDKELSVTLYPNPAANRLNIKGLDDTVERIDIFDISGQLIESFSGNRFNDVNFEIDVSNYAPGSYLLKVNGVSTSVDRFVISR